MRQGIAGICFLFVSQIVQAAPFGDTTDLGGGWKWSSWFGTFNDSNENWIFHNEHGWFFTESTSETSVWLWSESMDWLWTSATNYPNLFRAREGVWLWYQLASTNPRYFYNFSTALWEDDSKATQPPPASSKFDLGIAPNYSIEFSTEFDFARLKDMGVNRVNLYYTWKEFELGLKDPNDPNGTVLEEEVDPVIETLKSLGMRACIILEITDTDCEEGAPADCFTSFGVPPDIVFSGWDQEPLMGRLTSFVTNFAQRYDPSVVTHLFVGNETDMFLRRYSENQTGFVNLIENIQSALNAVENRPKFGTIFTFTVNLESHNDIARLVAPKVEVMAFTIYPSLEASWEDRPEDPTPELVETWFNEAKAIAGDALVVTETGYPTANPIGSDALQKTYVNHLVDYLRSHGDGIDFVSWYSLWDGPNHPDSFYHSVGLITYPQEVRKEAFQFWIDAGE